MRDLELLGTFLEVYRAGSITAAALQLRLSQPSVSERLARLERELDETLFIRSSRGVTATIEADRLAARIGEPIDRLRSVWLSSSLEVTGTVRVGGPTEAIASRVVPALAPLSMRGIRLRYNVGRSASVFESLIAGQLDVVISTFRPTDDSLRYHGLIDEEFVLIGVPSLARTVDPARLRSDPANALAHLPLVAYDDELLIVERYWKSQFGFLPSNPVNVTVPDLRGVLAAVVAGAGISAVPRYLAEPSIASGTVEILHRSAEATINTLFVVIPAAQPSSAAVSTVITVLLETAKTWDVF